MADDQATMDWTRTHRSYNFLVMNNNAHFVSVLWHDGLSKRSH